MEPSAQRAQLDAPGVDQRRHHLYNILAWMCFGLGFVGILLPLMPTTVFWICAAWLWLRSRPHRVKFLVGHPRFGESIRGFLERGEICRTGKKAAVLGMTGSLALWLLLFTPDWRLGLLVGAILTAVAAWISTRPEGRPQPKTSVAVTLNPGSWAAPASKPATDRSR
ncbi:DUF454 domain-containing protein [Thiorhodococcus mannitoliphagus]|uniref:DUF454 domain-containing protein n=1 Tax=Thiorhodococcus mannitoliphagus TaxID=329406 RepID=A0A6P1DY55_9GAMM|nr:YbaN family protein [Thiorhodococcus mannitoliphagus]NEX23247.1 DUF454 domain-containing protein [Thiorhodococcus mannitoliphagus]